MSRSSSPKPGGVSDKVFNDLTSLPTRGCMDKAFCRKHFDEHALEIIIPRNEVYVNPQSVVYKITVRRKFQPAIRVHAKRIKPVELPERSLEAWKDFVASVSREVEFYNKLLKNEIAEDLKNIFPHVYYSCGRIGESDTDLVSNTFFLVLMEDVSSQFEQAASMDDTRCRSLIACLAKLHATFWKDSILDQLDRGSFWVLERRLHLKEIEDAPVTWQAILKRLPELQDVVPDIETLGSEIAAMAKQLDDFVGRYSHLTLIHGDCKGYNYFFNKINPQKVLLIDLQWTGKGHPLQDVAYSLTTSLDAKLLDNMDEYLNTYLNVLNYNLNLDGITVSIEALKKQFDIVWLDYARIVMTGLWKNLSKEKMKRNERLVGPSMINRSLDHVKFIIKRAHRILRENRSSLEDRLRSDVSI